MYVLIVQRYFCALNLCKDNKQSCRGGIMGEIFVKEIVIILFNVHEQSWNLMSKIYATDQSYFVCR